jgi:hypothetical protein
LTLAPNPRSRSVHFQRAVVMAGKADASALYEVQPELFAVSR